MCSSLWGPKGTKKSLQGWEKEVEAEDHPAFTLLHSPWNSILLPFPKYNSPSLNITVLHTLVWISLLHYFLQGEAPQHVSPEHPERDGHTWLGMWRKENDVQENPPSLRIRCTKGRCSWLTLPSHPYSEGTGTPACTSSVIPVPLKILAAKHTSHLAIFIAQKIC